MNCWRNIAPEPVLTVSVESKIKVYLNVIYEGNSDTLSNVCLLFFVSYYSLKNFNMHVDVNFKKLFVSLEPFYFYENGRN